MPSTTISTAARNAPSATTEPFRFAAPEGFEAGAKSLALMWTLPMRTMMVVLGEAARPYRR
ncbi:MAG: hypothetical protein ACFBWO_13295 [Paracoccaceae bacterium]